MIHTEYISDPLRYCRYMLGVHNPRTNTLTLHSAPVHSFSTSVKALKDTPAIKGSDQYTAQRALLGATFGTKKAIRSINAVARNKLDHDSYGGGKYTQELLQSSLAGRSISLPTAAAVEETANLSRLIPPPNFDAKAPREVYDMDDVVTPTELESIDLTPYLEAETAGDRVKLLPFRRSAFIKDRLFTIMSKKEDSEELTRKDQKKLRLLLHLSQLLAFRGAVGRKDALERSNLMEKLGSPASIIVDGLLERYTEVQRSADQGADVRKVTVATEVKLVSYLLVVALSIDSWGTDVGTIADDLKMPPKR